MAQKITNRIRKQNKYSKVKMKMKKLNNVFFHLACNVQTFWFS